MSFNFFMCAEGVATCRYNLGLYQHYKGPQYRVFSVARHSETEEDVVFYQALYGDFGFWVRPLSMFLESVVVDGEQVPRFALIRGRTQSFFPGHKAGVAQHPALDLTLLPLYIAVPRQARTAFHF
jgi:hypothetical protein